MYESNPIRLLDLGPTVWWRTQAVYHAVAELMRADSPDTIIITHPLTPYLCLGYHQVYDAVLDRATCERRQLPVVRRQVGGGATYLDIHQLFYQCVFHHTRVPAMLRDVYAQMLAAPVAALRQLGLNAELWDVNEIEVERKRIAGVGGGRIGEACVVVGNLLFDFDYTTMTNVWRVPAESFRELAAAALREQVTTLWRLIGPTTIFAVQTMLIEEFARALGRPLKRGKLTREETHHSSQVAARLASPESLSLHSENGSVAPMKSLKISARVAIHAAETEIGGRRIRGSFRVREGIIEEARLDIAGGQAWENVQADLRGVPFREWQERLPVG
ncbi:MAG: lipoate--protein ligase family protein [Ardenticatenaceae bacterium]|nr:lipoate--protein ligase family protein [Ardenticatenaceae bacterium]HBY94910.1 hypothetical protein [Chloroflexota bacterium]